MMLNKNKKVKVCLVDRDTDFFDIVADVLQRDALTPYPFVICTSNVDKANERTWFYSKKARSRRYPALTITDIDDADGIVVDAPTQAEFQLHSLELATGGITSMWMQTKRSTCVLIKRRHLHTKCWFSEISGQVHQPRKQRLIYWKWHQCVTSEVMEYYR